MFKLKKETTGIFFIFLASILWGGFAVFVNKGSRIISPLTFAAISTLLASFPSLFFLIKNKKYPELKNRKNYFNLLMVTICIVIIPYSLFFIGASKTSGANTSILLLSEIIFTLIITPFFGEKNNLKKILGAGGIFLGALIILYNGTLKFNPGDILIILSTLTYPFGNLYAKKALNISSASTILFVRFLLGGLFISLLAFVFENPLDQIDQIFINWPTLLTNGLIALGLSKIFWYKGFKTMDITKSISIGKTSPLFSLIILIIFFGEVLSTYQIIGIIIMFIGVYFTVTRKSTDPKLTLYA
jgi:drug/metabolite transporter (DMT)-like permease